MAIPDFPQTLPCPQIDGTQASFDAGLIRTQFDGGNSRQRRIYKNLPSIYPVQWVVSQKIDLAKLIRWLNDNGWTWFNLKLPGILASTLSQDTAVCRVRLITDLNTELINTRRGYYWRVRSALEWVDAGLTIGVGGTTAEGWMIARGPATVAADWVIAGSAVTPSVLGPIIGGHPTHPSAPSP